MTTNTNANGMVTLTDWSVKEDPLPVGADLSDRELLLTIYQEVIELKAAHTETVAKVNELLTKAMPHIEQLGPMVEGLAGHPMVKMLVGKKK